MIEQKTSIIGETLAMTAGKISKRSSLDQILMPQV